MAQMAIAGQLSTTQALAEHLFEAFWAFIASQGLPRGCTFEQLGGIQQQAWASVAEAAEQRLLAQELPALTTSQLLTVHSALDQAAVYTRLLIARAHEDLPGHEDLLAEQDALVDLFDRELAEAEAEEVGRATGGTCGGPADLPDLAPVGPNRAPDSAEGSERSAW